MKKKLLTLFMALVLMLSNCMVTFAANQTIPASDALKGTRAGNAYIFDVRSDVSHTAENLDHEANVIHLPLFDADNKLDTEAALTNATNFTNFVTKNKDTYSTKPIYILCNSGRSGAEKATELLTAADYDPSMVYTITNGAKAIEIRYAMLHPDNKIKGDAAIADAANPKTKSIILDVRNDAKRAEVGVLENSVHIPVFTADGPVVGTKDDQLAKDFIAKTENNALGDDETKIYILCNGGQSGARAATVLLHEGAKYPLANIITIEDGAGSAELADDLVKEITEYNYISGQDALTAANQSKGYIVDVRSEIVHGKTDNNLDHLSNVVWQPLFVTDAAGNNSLPENLESPFVTEMLELKDNLTTDQNIYILCNSGSRGAEKATKLLVENGFDQDNIFTITNGAKGLDIRYAMLNHSQKVSNTNAAKAVGSTEVVILDVRATEVSNANPLKGSNVFAKPVFDRIDNKNVVAATKEDKLADEFIKFAQGNAKLAEKEIYILCNSGQSGARAATVLLTDAGYSKDQIHTIEFGATGLEMRYKFIESQVGADVTGDEAIAAVGNDNIVILDVRNNAKYAEGHLNQSISAPIFSETPAPNGTPANTANDQLAKDFVATVTARKALLEGKEIYVLCNGGQRGARAAAVLLGDAGFDLSKVHTITGGAGAIDSESFTTEPTRYYIDGQTAVTNAKATDKNAVIIDVRAESVAAKNPMPGALEMPLFRVVDGNNQVVDTENTTDPLVQAFNDDLVANADKLTGEIYILCNSGASGATAATKLLAKAGYLDSNIYTITNGAKGLDVRYAMLGENPTTPVTSEQALAAIGNDNIVILDVRAAGNFAKGHLKGAVSAPLFNSNGVVPTADTKDAATNAHQALVAKFLEDAKDLAGKEIYVLCNSGQSGARAATVLLHKEAGIPLEKIHTITGGYKENTDIQAAAIYITPERAINAAETPETDKLIIDVRAAELYAAGHLKGSVSLPLFNSNKELPDDLAEAFVAAVKANKEAFEGKTVYILCNSGSRGAVKATELLAELGITNVFTIEGGAGTETIKPYLTSTEPTTLEDIIERDNASDSGEAESEESTESVKTGDSTNIMPYTLTMAFALLAIILVSKKKFTK